MIGAACDRRVVGDRVMRVLRGDLKEVIIDGVGILMGKDHRREIRRLRQFAYIIVVITMDNVNLVRLEIPAGDEDDVIDRDPRAFEHAFTEDAKVFLHIGEEHHETTIPADLGDPPILLKLVPDDQGGGPARGLFFILPFLRFGALDTHIVHAFVGFFGSVQ